MKVLLLFYSSSTFISDPYEFLVVLVPCSPYLTNHIYNFKIPQDETLSFNPRSSSNRFIHYHVMYCFKSQFKKRVQNNTEYDWIPLMVPYL